MKNELIPYSAKRPDNSCVCADEIDFIINCPNMKSVDGDLDMEAEHYECKVCGKTETLYYDEMA